MSRDVRTYLADMVTYASRALSHAGGRSRDQLVADQLVLDAVVLNVQIVGEAAKRIPIEVRARAPHVAWQNAARMRDRLVHHYWNVNPDVRWEVVSLELPALRDAVAALVAELDTESPPPP